MSTPARTPKASSPPKIPPEVLGLIIAEVERSELPYLIGVSRRFHHLCSPLLYQHIFIGIWAVKSAPEWGSVGDLLERRDVVDVLPIGMTDAVHLIIHWLPQPYDPFPLPLLPPRLNNVTRLCVRAHYFGDPDVCGVSPLIMPNLYSLQILPFNNIFPEVYELDVCSLFLPTIESSPSCPLLLNLRPRQLILGGAATALVGCATGLGTADTPFPPPRLEEVVIFIGHRSRLPGPSFIPHRPSTVKRLTLAFQALENADEWQQSDNLEDEVDEEDMEMDAALRFWTRLAACCQGLAGEVVVVGFEIVNGASVGRSGWADGEGPAVLKGILARQRMDRGMLREEAEKKGDEIRFIERAVWKEQERNRDVRSGC